MMGKATQVTAFDEDSQGNHRADARYTLGPADGVHARWGQYYSGANT
jgi:hypothetical protein